MLQNPNSDREEEGAGAVHTTYKHIRIVVIVESELTIIAVGCWIRTPVLPTLTCSCGARK